MLGGADLDRNVGDIWQYNSCLRDLRLDKPTFEVPEYLTGLLHIWIDSGSQIGMSLISVNLHLFLQHVSYKLWHLCRFY